MESGQDQQPFETQVTAVNSAPLETRGHGVFDEVLLGRMV